MSQDTSPEAELRYAELLRTRLPRERLAIAVALSQAVREMAAAGIRARHTNATPREVRVRLAVRLYGREAGIRLFGAVPDDAV